MDCVYQINHDVHVPGTGADLVFHPHVHWAAMSAPTASQTIIWEFEFISAKPTTDGSATFGSSSTTLTAATYTTDGNELRKHFLTDLGDITITQANFGSSLVIWGVLRLKDTSTIASGKIAMLGFDLHKRVGRFGSAGEYA
jgi:hypothetical protein